MQKNEFRGPLMQSAAVLGGVLILFAVVASSGTSGSEGGILSIIFGIGNLILFFIGMAIALPFTIALLIAIFLAAVAMVNPEQASQMYSDLKKNFALNALSLIKQCCADSQSETGITTEEYDRMKLEIAQLHDKNLKLQKDIKDLIGGKSLLQENVADLTGKNSALKQKIEEMSVAIEHLQNSEKDIKNLVEQLTTKIQAGADQELKDQIKKLEQLYGETHIEIENLMQRLNTLETGLKQSPVSGIFAYVESEKDQALFIEKVEEALSQEMTYAQIDEYLTKTLPPELDKIIKDHPALTKNYIRNLRRD